MTILITRPQPEANALADILRKSGYPCLLDPLLTVKTLKIKPIQTSNAQAFVFTSAHGVRCLSAALDLQLDQSRPAFAVGHATADALKEAGFKNVFIGNKGGLELCQLIQNHLDSNSYVIHFSGKHTAVDMASQLRQSGFQAKRYIIYDAIASTKFSDDTYQALVNQDIQAALFFSPRTAQIFARLIDEGKLTKKCKTVIAICFSKKITQPLQQIVWKDILVTQTPEVDQVLNILKETKLCD